MRSIVGVRIYNKENLGDTTTTPLDYFEFPGFTKRRAHIWHEQKFSEDVVIVGGGGIIHPSYLSRLQRIATSRVPRQKTIFWGGGLNFDTQQEYPSWMKKFHMVGVRDFGQVYDWVPCPSCMSDVFDIEKKVVRRVGIYDHMDWPVPVAGPRMCNNERSLKKVVDFIAGSSLLLTSSYHGMYWAFLLAVPVITFPLCTRFDYSRWQTPLVREGDWQDKIEDAVSAAEECKGALVEARERNRWFYSRVCNFIKEER